MCMFFESDREQPNHANAIDHSRGCGKTFFFPLY